MDVGTSTIKRWADEGRLQCHKTAGGHRRFSRGEVLAMRAGGSSNESGLRTEHILADGDGHATLAALMQMRSTRGSWCSVASELGLLLGQIGEDWASGKLSIVQEHIISERLSRAITSICQGIPLASSSPTCLMVMAGNDQHTLGLRLAELTAREAGWKCLWVGRNTPIGELSAALSESGVRALAVSASEHSQCRDELAQLASTFMSIAKEARVPLYLGGQGAWPESLAYGVRIRNFASFREQLLTSAAG